MGIFKHKQGETKTYQPEDYVIDATGPCEVYTIKTPDGIIYAHFDSSQKTEKNKWIAEQQSQGNEVHYIGHYQEIQGTAEEIHNRHRGISLIPFRFRR